ncbi:MAG: hypothetical protein HYW24_00115 [Candidatus Aenigmarchaeota archaeon]|nr:hypothetical protein [Candidatus Aenigmarchaeota archaeon]
MKYSYKDSQRVRKVNTFMGSLIKFHFMHQNIIILVLGLVFAYFLAHSGLIYAVTEFLAQFGYLSALLLGFLFSYGALTAASAVAIFVISKSFNPVLIALIAGLGAMISNFLIYRFIKEDVLEEVKFIFSREMGFDVERFEHRLNQRVYRSKFLQAAIPAISGILVSLPLPTEVFVSVLWAIARYDAKKVLFFSFLFSFLGILNIALLSRVIG